MVKLCSVRSNHLVHRYRLYPIAGFRLKGRWCVVDGENPFYDTNIKGNITTTPSSMKAGIFNNCHHTESDGYLWLRDDDDNTVCPRIEVDTGAMGPYDEFVGVPSALSTNFTPFEGTSEHMCCYKVIAWRNRMGGYYCIQGVSVCTQKSYSYDFYKVVYSRAELDSLTPDDIQLNHRVGWSDGSDFTTKKTSEERVRAEFAYWETMQYQKIASVISKRANASLLGQIFTDVLQSCRDLHVMNTCAQLCTDYLISTCIMSIVSQGKNLAKMLTPTRLNGKLHFTIPAQSVTVFDKVTGAVRTVSGEEVKGIRQSISAYDTLLRTSKGAADIHLAVQYGVKAPYHDYVDIAQQIAQDHNQGGMVPYFNNTHVARRNVSLAEDSDGIDGNLTVICGLAFDAGKTDLYYDGLNILWQRFALTWSDLWDLVPLSFAIDWIVNISSLLKAYEASQISTYYPVDLVWRTFSYESKELTVELPQAQGTVKCTYYDRYADKSVLPNFSNFIASADVGGTISLNNAKEAVSLAVSFLTSALLK